MSEYFTVPREKHRYGVKNTGARQSQPLLPSLVLAWRKSCLLAKYPSTSTSKGDTL
jgi:hypothetical protein